MRISAFLLVAGLAVPGHAMDAYSWKTETGTVAYTDDHARIPSRYAGEAARVRLGKLKDYERLTIAKSMPALTLREIPEPMDLRPAPAAPSASMTPGQEVLIQASPGVTLPVTMAGSGEPIRVEEYVHLWEDGFLYPFTVVKQGDRVLVEVRHPF